MKRTERLFALAEHLRSRRTGTTAQALADRFGVTVRTIYRDLDSLRAADLPVVGERGRGGGLALEPGYSLPPVNFNPREAALLVACGEWLMASRVMPFTGTLSQALDKVRAALPTAHQRALARQRQALSFVGVPAKSPPDEVKAVIETAWFEDKPVEITEQRREVFRRYRVHIRGVVMDRQETLLNCDLLDAPPEVDSRRQFKLHRIVEAHLAVGGRP